MDEDRIRDLVTELNDQIAAEGGCVRLMYDDSPLESIFMGDRLGYMRLGLELLKAGRAESGAAVSHSIQLNIENLLASDSNIDFVQFIVSESVASRAGVELNPGQNMLGWIVTLTFLAVIALAALGLWSLVG
jgi:hypothetical protein